MLESLFCIAAGKPGGGTLLAHCFPDHKAPESTQKVNGWGPFFANDRCSAFPNSSERPSCSGVVLGAAVCCMRGKPFFCSGCSLLDLISGLCDRDMREREEAAEPAAQSRAKERGLWVGGESRYGRVEFVHSGVVMVSMVG